MDFNWWDYYLNSCSMFFFFFVELLEAAVNFELINFFSVFSYFWSSWFLFAGFWVLGQRFLFFHCLCSDCTLAHSFTFNSLFLVKIWFMTRICKFLSLFTANEFLSSCCLPWFYARLCDSVCVCDCEWVRERELFGGVLIIYRSLSFCYGNIS